MYFITIVSDIILLTHSAMHVSYIMYFITIVSDITYYFFKHGIWLKNWLIWEIQSHRPLVLIGIHLKSQ